MSADLQAQLVEKQELIAALTARLEQAADQLDRVQRGGERNPRTAGRPATSLVEQQEAIADRMNGLVDRWEQLEMGVSIGRLEMQVEELRDLISGRFEGTTLDRPSQPLATDQDSVAEDEPVDDEPADDEESNGSGWEALKASILNGDPVEIPTAPILPPEPTEPGSEDASVDSAAAISSANLEADGMEPLPESVPAPDEIDTDTASIDELRDAVESRDAYIVHLLRLMRWTEQQPPLPTDWSLLSDVPEELRENLKQLEHQLEQRLRLAEIEFSVERARLGREAARLRQLENEFSAEDEGAEPEHQSAPEGSRWLRFLTRPST